MFLRQLEADLFNGLPGGEGQLPTLKDVEALDDLVDVVGDRGHKTKREQVRTKGSQSPCKHWCYACYAALR